MKPMLACTAYLLTLNYFAGESANTYDDDRHCRQHSYGRRHSGIYSLSKDFAMLLRYGRGWPPGLIEDKDGSLRLSDIHCHWAEPRGATYGELVRALRMNQYRYGDSKRWELAPEGDDPTHVKLSSTRPPRDDRGDWQHFRPYNENSRLNVNRNNRQSVLDQELDDFMGRAGDSTGNSYPVNIDNPSG